MGVVLSATGLGALVYGVLRSSEWGWVAPKPGSPSWPLFLSVALGLSALETGVRILPC